VEPTANRKFALTAMVLDTQTDVKSAAGGPQSSDLFVFAEEPVLQVVALPP
jgi:hypothetical protein